MEDGQDWVDTGYDGAPHQAPPPSRQPQHVQPPLYIMLGLYLRYNIHILLILAALAYFAFRMARNAYYTRNPKRNASVMLSMQEQMMQARQRQQEAVLAARSGPKVIPTPDMTAEKEQEATSGQSEPAKAPVTTAQELMAQVRQRQQEAAKAAATGPKGTPSTGTATKPEVNSSATAAPPTQPTEQPRQPESAPKPKLVPPKQSTVQKQADEDSDEDPRGPRKRLPKLSGGDRAQWESDNRSGGGDDRKNYFKRDCGPKGG